MKTLGVLKQNHHNKIVVLIPENIQALKNYFDHIYIESESGIMSGYSNNDYTDYGAEIATNPLEVIEKSSIILTFDTIPDSINRYSDKTFIGFFNCLFDFSVLIPFKGINAEIHSLDLLPRTTLAQTMDVLSSIASISGYQAVITASNLYGKSIPMITSAAGTLHPARVLIIGAGVSGLQAIATAKRLGARVRAFDVRNSSKTEVESLGAVFIEIDGAADNEKNGGYAEQQSDDYIDKIQKTLYDECVAADIIISSAKIPGKKAPILITEEIVKNMNSGSIIIDLAAETGGNCAMTKANNLINYNGVTIVGEISMVSKCAQSSSFLLSNNYTSFLKYYLTHENHIDTDPILSKTLVMKKSEIVHTQLLEAINTY